MCAGYDNGDVKLFDLRTMSLRWETNVKNGVSGSLLGNPLAALMCSCWWCKYLEAERVLAR